MSQISKINWGQKAVVKKNENYKIIELKENIREKFENCHFYLDGAIGFPFGTKFIIEKNQLIPFSKDNDLHGLLTSKSDEKSEEKKDNRALVDCSENQSLSTDSIKQMKKEGATGVDILSKLVENSASFASKTKFSQEKYLLKKKKRHLPIISILKPSTRILCDVYSGKRRSKVLGIRIDTMSQILSYANVHHGTNVLLSETCAGLVLGAILERQGHLTDTLPSKGNVFHFFHGTAPVRPDFLSIQSPDHKSWWSSSVTEVPMRDLTALRLIGDIPKRVQLPWKSTGQEAVAENENEVNDVVGECDEDEDNCLTEPDSKRIKVDDDSQANIDKHKSKILRQEAAKEVLFSTSWDALIVAVKFHPQDLVVGLLHFLSPGRPIVVYCQYLQPLAELFNCLKQRGNVEMLQIHETWYRHYQILPERSHPAINMSGTGGYLLTGITSISDDLVDPITDYEQRYISAAR